MEDELGQIDSWLKEKSAPQGGLGDVDQWLAKNADPRPEKVRLQDPRMDQARQWAVNKLGSEPHVLQETLGAGGVGVRDILENSIPGVSTGIKFNQVREYRKAKEAYDKGEATDEQIGNIAQYELSEGRKREMGTGRSIVQGVLQAPAVIGEAALAAPAVAPLARGLGLAPAVAGSTASILSREGAKRLAVEGAKAGATQALATPLTPSLWLEESQQRANQNGGSWYTPSNLAAPLAKSAMTNAILGQLGQTTQKLPLAAKIAGGALGMPIEQQAADAIATSAEKALEEAGVEKKWLTETKWGTIGAFARGENGEAWKRLATEATLGAGFAALHGRKADPIAVLAETAKEMGKKGYSSEKAAIETAKKVGPELEEALKPPEEAKVSEKPTGTAELTPNETSEGVAGASKGGRKPPEAPPGPEVEPAARTAPEPEIGPEAKPQELPKTEVIAQPRPRELPPEPSEARSPELQRLYDHPAREKGLIAAGKGAEKFLDQVQALAEKRSDVPQAAKRAEKAIREFHKGNIGQATADAEFALSAMHTAEAMSKSGQGPISANGPLGRPRGAPPLDLSGPGYKTEKGSNYVLHEDGTTTRIKAARDAPGHEGDFGEKDRTHKTVYVDGNVVSALSAAGLHGVGKRGARLAMKDGKATLLTWNEKQHKWGAAPSGTNAPISNTPKVGLHPLELWDRSDDVPGYEAYTKQHAGSKITEVRSGQAAESRAAGPEGNQAKPAVDAAGAEFGRPLSAEERTKGQIGGGQENAGEAKPDPLRETALANAKVDAERVKNGLPPLMSEARRSNPEVWDRAMKTLADDPTASTRLVDELAKKSRPVSAEENALLLHRKIGLSNEYERTIRHAADAFREKNMSLFDSLAGKSDDLLAQIDKLNKVERSTGSEAGRAFQFRKQLADEQYALTRMMQEATIKKRGPLTPEEMAEIQKLHDRIKELEAELAKIQGGEKVPGKDEKDVTIDIDKEKKKYKDRIEKYEQSHRSIGRKVFDAAKNTGDLYRAFKTSYDLSAVLRQGAANTGGMLLRQPVKLGKNIVGTVKDMMSVRHYDRNQLDIRSHKDFKRAEDAGLYMADIPQLGLKGTKEETFTGKWPVLRAKLGIAAAERAYNGYLNRLRFDTFNYFMDRSARGTATANEAKALANAINVATGRGKTPESMAGAMNGAAQVLFSPRYMLSRFQLLAGQPFYSGTWRTRRILATEMARSLTAFGIFVGFVKASNPDVEIEWDPRSSDFGKMRFGNFRLDPLAGLSQTMVFLTRNATGETKSTTTGKIHDLRGPGHKFGETDMLDVWKTFGRNKLAPLPGIAADVGTGESGGHQPAPTFGTFGRIIRGKATARDKDALKREAKDVISPISFGDVFDALKDQGVPRGIALSLAAILGQGTQLYEPKVKK